jgi:4'-phosphopantetheinyl transferase EntD
MFDYKNIHIGDLSIYTIRYNSYCLNDFFTILSENERKQLSSFSSVKRQYEYLSTRILKEQIFPGQLIKYNSSGAPYIEEGPYISISHFSGVSAIGVSKKYPIGLDIEPIGSKAQLLHTKFLNEQEKAFLDTTDELLMTRAWSCKEALLKLCNRKGILFKHDLIIDSYDGNESFMCSILKDHELFSVHLTSKLIDGMVLTINTSNPMKKKHYEID